MDKQLTIARLNSPITIIFEVDFESIGLKCPYCGIIEINTDGTIPDGCKHIVFTYDWTNGEYIDVSPAFLEYLKHVFGDGRRFTMNEETERESIEEFLSKGTIPFPKLLTGWIQFLRLYEAYDVEGSFGFFWGHASERLIQKISRLS